MARDFWLVLSTSAQIPGGLMVSIAVLLTLLSFVIVCMCVHTVRRWEVCLQSRLQKRVARKKVGRLEHVKGEGEGGELGEVGRREREGS